MIDDLGSYSIDRFIPFLPESYWRLFERQHEALWPTHLALLAVGIAATILALRGNTRSVAVLLAAATATTAITFQLQLYAELTPVGLYIGWAFLAQATLILLWGFTSPSISKPKLNSPTVIGTSIALFGLAAYPLLTPFTNRNWTGAELFGMAPDPTICTLLGITLILARPLWLLALLPIPLIWCATTAATLHAVNAPLPFILPAIATLTLATTIWKLFSTYSKTSPD